MSKLTFSFLSIIIFFAISKCVIAVERTSQRAPIHVAMKSINVAGEVVYYWDINAAVNKEVVRGFVQLRSNSIYIREPNYRDIYGDKFNNYPEYEYENYLEYTRVNKRPFWDFLNLSDNILYATNHELSLFDDMSYLYGKKTTTPFADFFEIHTPRYSVVDFYPVMYAFSSYSNSLIMIDEIKYNNPYNLAPSDLSNSSQGDLTHKELLRNSLNGVALIAKIKQGEPIKLRTDDYFFLLETDVYQAEVLQEYLQKIALATELNELAKKEVEKIGKKVSNILLAMYTLILLIVIILFKCRKLIKLASVKTLTVITKAAKLILSATLMLLVPVSLVFDFFRKIILRKSSSQAVDELLKLSELHEKGIIDTDTFEKKKNQLTRKI